MLSPIFNEKAVVVKAAADVTIAETQASVSILQLNAANIALRIATDIICFPVACWTALISWDTIVANHWPHLMWHTANYPASVGYLPYAVLTFLLGNIGLNLWKLK